MEGNTATDAWKTSRQSFVIEKKKKSCADSRRFSLRTGLQSELRTLTLWLSAAPLVYPEGFSDYYDSRVTSALGSVVLSAELPHRPMFFVPPRPPSYMTDTYTHNRSLNEMHFKGPILCTLPTFPGNNMRLYRVRKVHPQHAKTRSF